MLALEPSRLRLTGASGRLARPSPVQTELWFRRASGMAKLQGANMQGQRFGYADASHSASRRNDSPALVR
jgi:hypothetical protein